MLLTKFSHAEGKIACPRTIICYKCEQNDMGGEILNAGDNVDDQDFFWVYRVIFQNCTYATRGFETLEKNREQ